MRTGFSPATRGRVRALNLVMFLPALIATGILLAIVDSDTWLEGAVLGLGVLAGLVAVVRWADGRVLEVAAPCVAVAGAVWVFGAATGSSTGFYSFLIVAPLVVTELVHHRRAAAVGAALFVMLVGATRLLIEPGDITDTVVAFVVVPTGLVAVQVGLMFPNRRFYDLMAELEESRDREADLAVARERIRFAGDLHDIQGHTLHVVKLKVALARRLVHTDPDRVETELAEIQELIGDTIAQSKALVHAHRRLNLSVELENAKNLFEAAGIDVQVVRDVRDIDAGISEVLGQVLRETTTNILRHAQATEVRITLSANSLEIVNDGAAEGEVPELSGLATLADRVSGQGGDLRVTMAGGVFRTAATLPAVVAVSTLGDEQR